MNLDDLMEAAEIYSRSTRFKKKLDDTLYLCKEVLKAHDRPYIACSGGKDSAVMARVLQETGFKMPLWAHVSDASFPGTKEYLQDLSILTKFPLELSECPFSALETAATSPERQKFGKSGVFYSEVRKYAQDKDLAFVGVRGYESKRRMKAAKIHGSVFHSKSMGNVDVCYPMLWWKLEDVLAAAFKFSLPLHPIYSKVAIDLGKNANGEYKFIRLGYITSKDLLDKGTALFLKLNYPDIFVKYSAVYPDITLKI